MNIEAVENQGIVRIEKKAGFNSFSFFLRSLLINGLLILVPLLIVSVYSILRTASESVNEVRDAATVTLRRADDVLDSYYNLVDNAAVFLNSNPSASRQVQQAFREPVISLDSMREMENISLSFQNQIYTNDALDAVYIYYSNDYDRIFSPLHSRILSLSEDGKDRVLYYFDRVTETDVWMEFTDTPILSSEFTQEHLLICRRLSRRVTGMQNGVVIYSFRADRLEKELEGLLTYNDQRIFLIDQSSQTVWPSSDDFSSEVLMELLEENSERDTAVGGVYYDSWHTACMSASASYGFSVLLVTPRTEIFATSMHLTAMYALITCIAAAVAVLLAWVKTKRDYRYLHRIITIFTDPNTVVRDTSVPRSLRSDPLEFILLNVINLFIEQDYLRIRDSEKEARLRLWQAEALQHQINPHFINNTLNAIYWESVRITGDENQCSIMIARLSSLMRYALSDAQEDVSVAEEISYLETYVGIMEMRFPGLFRTEFDVAKEYMDAPIKKMLLQPLVENSVTHGLRVKPGGGELRITVHDKKERLYFNVYDTGAGMNEETLATLRESLSGEDERMTQHIGLANTNARLKLSYGEDAGLQIESRDGEFTMIWFSIPLKQSLPPVDT